MTALFGTTIEVITYVCSAISLLPSIAVIFCYWYFPHIRTFVTKTIMWLAVAEFISSVGRYIPDCTTFGFLEQFTALSTLCWMATVAAVQYLTVVKHFPSLHRYETLFHIFNWGFPLIDAAVQFPLPSRLHRPHPSRARPKHNKIKKDHRCRRRL